MPGLLLVTALAAQAVTSGAPAPAPTATQSSAATTSATNPGESTYVDLEGGGGYSSNPNLSLGSNTGAAFGRVSAHAVHSRVSARTTTVLSGFAQSVFYTNHYSSAQSFDVNGRHDAAVSERLRIFFDGDAAYDKGGQLDTRILGVPGLPLPPGTVVPPTLLNPGGDFLTVTGKSYRADAHVGGQYSVSQHGFLDLTTGIEHDVFKTGSIETRYTTIPLAVGYQQQLNERTTVGARVAASFTHYAETVSNPSRNYHVITPEVTGQFKLSPTLSLSGDVGASFASVRNGGGVDHNTTGLAGDVNLCSTGERTQMCARASVQEQAATSAGPARVISVGVDYSRRLTADDTIQFSLSGNRYTNPVILVSSESFTRATYARAAVDYSRKIGQRLFGGVDLAARKISETGPDPRADLSASVFIRYRFGDVQ